MKKTYENPEFIYLTLLSSDVITASVNHSGLNKEEVEKDDDNSVFWGD